VEIERVQSGAVGRKTLYEVAVGIHFQSLFNIIYIMRYRRYGKTHITAAGFASIWM